MTIRSTFHAVWQISRHSSRGYKFAQGLTFLVFAAVYLSYALPFFDLETPQVIFIFTAKYLLEAAIFVAFCHYILRSTFKLFLTQQHMSMRQLLLALLVLIAVSIVFTAISLGLTFLPLFQVADLSSVYFQPAEGDRGLQVTFDMPTMFTMLVLTNLCFFMLWSCVYGFWQMVESRRQLQLQMQEARIQQLTNQLSPHFLFNAMNSIRALIYEDRDKAAATLTRLSELFRFHLQADLRPTATLQEEWYVTEQYLDIEKVRLEQRLQVNLSVDEELWQQKLPTLALLTLFENAIKHGISPNHQPGMIELSAERCTDHWELVIKNTMDAQTQQAGTSTGLANIDKRLKLMFGEQVTMQAGPQDGYYQVKVELPYVSNAIS